MMLMRKSQASAWSRVILNQLGTLSRESPIPTTNRLPPRPCRALFTSSHSCDFPTTQLRLRFRFPGENRLFSSARTIQELLADVERTKQKEREEKRRVGLDAADIDAEDEEDYMGVGPLIEKLEKEKLKDSGADLNMYEEPTDSESEDDERFTPDAIKKRAQVFEKKFKRHEELLKNFTEAGTYFRFTSPSSSILVSPEFSVYGNTEYQSYDIEINIHYVKTEQDEAIKQINNDEQSGKP